MIEKTENKRYKQLTYHGEKFLLDMDSNKITWFFPFLVWFFPVKGYEHKELPILTENKQTNGGGGIVLTASVLSGILVRMTSTGFGDLSLLPNYEALIIVLVISSMTIVFLVRYFWRYKKNKLFIKDNEVVSVKFKFRKGIFGKIEYGYKFFILIIICYAILMYCSYFFINVYPNVIVLPIILLIEYFILIVNTTIPNPDVEDDIIILQEEQQK